MNALGYYIGNLPPEGHGNASKDLVDDDVFIGVEWEIEASNKHEPPRSPYFKVEPDGTLKNNGAEYYFSSPFRGRKALSAIETFYKNSDFNLWDASVRCSTHLHVDCRGLTENEVILYILLLASNDEALYAITDSMYRMESPFAIQSWNNPFFWDEVRKFRNDNFHTVMCSYSSDRKYTSINLINLFKPHRGRTGSPLGTIELRHSRCITEKRVLLDFVNLALSLRKQSLGTTDPFNDFAKIKSPKQNYISKIIGK